MTRAGAIPFLSPGLFRGRLAPHSCGRFATLKPMNMKRLSIPAAGAALSLSVCAADLRPAGAFIQAGLAEHRTYNVTAGVLWPWSWQRDFGSAQAGGITEAFVSHWSGRGVTERESFTQLGLLPLVRLRLDGGRSPWFMEGGIGVSVMDRTFR